MILYRQQGYLDMFRRLYAILRGSLPNSDTKLRNYSGQSAPPLGSGPPMDFKFYIRIWWVIPWGWRIGAETCRDNLVDGKTFYFNCAFVGTINKCDNKNARCRTLQNYVRFVQLNQLRKILRRIYRPLCEGEIWRSRYNEELYRLYDWDRFGYSK